MKTLLFIFALSFSQTIFAKEIQQVKGSEARSIMEALSASGFELENGAGEWSGKTLIIKSGPIVCHFTAISPDEWMTNAGCNQGSVSEGPYLNQSLALAKSLQKYASEEGGLGNRWLFVDSIKCSLKYDEKIYLCLIK